MSITLTWKKIHALGRTKALQSSYLFLVAVPLFVALYPTVKEIPLFEIELPFTWIALFFAAISISIANTIYFIWCPDLIKQFSSFVEFRESGRGASFMANQLRQYSPRSLRDRPIEDVANELHRKHAAHLHADPAVLANVRADLSQPGAQVSQALFWTTFDIANNTQPAARVVASLCYYVGLGLVFIVFLQKVFSVLQHIWATRICTP